MNKAIKILTAVTAALTALGQVLVQANRYVELKSDKKKLKDKENNEEEETVDE